MAEVARSEAVNVRFGPQVGLLACTMEVRQRPVAMAGEDGWEAVRRQWAGQDVAALASDEVLSAYRRFLGGAGAGEDLLRRFLFEGGLKSINAVVDSVNLASARTKVTMAAFDAQAVEGEMLLDLAEQEERLRVIGGKEARIPKGELVLKDQAKVLSWLGRRDSEATKVEPGTREIWLLGVMVPGVGRAVVTHAILEAVHEMSQALVVRLSEPVARAEAPGMPW
jgi:DNA/RNA-binding domain of Phe-tRNA-synthetase-like protein